ncbi:MAG TPA: iron-sulfur protein [Clostridium sp.]|nr:iron-sulfur protein [Clostridium sp.]
MVGIYFSGTGNTKHCIGEFIRKLDDSASIISIEEPESIDAIKENDFIVFAYPIYFSSLPKIIRDYIKTNKEIFQGKKIFIIATMGLFSGDGAGCSARLFKKCGAEIIGGLHLKMPDCIGDEKALKKSLEQNKEIVKNAENKICQAVEKLKNKQPTKEGINIIYHAAGLFGQRLWFYNKTRNYSDKLKIDKSKCIGCGLCSSLCPMDNIEIIDKKAEPKEKCTMCYRCISNCPKQAITLIGKKVYEQCKSERYLDTR